LSGSSGKEFEEPLKFKEVLLPNVSPNVAVNVRLNVAGIPEVKGDILLGHHPRVAPAQKKGP
jgi:hypothetical protein